MDLIELNNGERVFLKKTKTKGFRLYFDNNRLMTENSFGTKQEAEEWLVDLESLRCPNCDEMMKDKVIGNICPKCDFLIENQA